MRLGLDIGSTYSTLARYVAGEDEVKGLTLSEGSPCSIPSAVAVAGDDDWAFGSAALDMIGDGDVYERFKMLILEENNDEILRQNGYDSGERSPRKILTAYLTNLLSAMMNRYEKGGRIDKLVACVPEEWDKSFRHLDGRNILRSILINDVTYCGGHRMKPEDVQIVTEPEAASAYFAHQYQKKANKPFRGHLLLIDFGGGTLDITLSRIYSNGDGQMEIESSEHGGCGENHKNKDGTFQIGCAGIAYMQQILRYALEDAAGDAENPNFPETFRYDPTDPDFAVAFKRLESKLKSPFDPNGNNRIEIAFAPFEDYSNFKKILTDPKYEDPKIGKFCEIRYGRKPLTITYRQIYRAYRDIIAQPLRKELIKITDKVKKYLEKDADGAERNPRKPAQGLQEDFKIALVGGFANFYLVQAQIYDFYNIDPDSEMDGRLKNIDAAKMEMAIACGAALIAADKVKLKKLAPLSMGLRLSNGGDGYEDLYAIRYHQPIVPNRPYYLLRQNAVEDTITNRVKLIGVTGITEFVIRDDETLDKGGIRALLKEEFQKKFAGLSGNCLYYFGLSMDENGIYSFHVEPTDNPNGAKKVQLASFQEMMELQGV